MVLFTYPEMLLEGMALVRGEKDGDHALVGQVSIKGSKQK